MLICTLDAPKNEKNGLWSISQKSQILQIAIHLGNILSTSGFHGSFQNVQTSHHHNYIIYIYISPYIPIPCPVYTVYIPFIVSDTVPRFTVLVLHPYCCSLHPQFPRYVTCKCAERFIHLGPLIHHSFSTKIPLPVNERQHSLPDHSYMYIYYRLVNSHH